MSSWTHLASTYDGAVLRLYVNGTQVSTTNVTGAMANSAGPLQIGGNNVWAEWFQGQIDDLRVYNRALTPSQLQTDMNTPVAPPPAGDTQAPSAPAGLAVSGQTQTALTLSWNASTDNVGVTGYSTYRNTVAAGTTAPATRPTPTPASPAEPPTPSEWTQSTPPETAPARRLPAARPAPVAPATPRHRPSRPAWSSAARRRPR